MFVGIIFYSMVNGWDFSVSYFFAATVLFGDMYLVPTEPNPWSHVFTLFYFLWGTTLLAGAITSAANMVVNSAVRIAAEERRRFFATTTGVGLGSDYYSEEPVAGYLAHIIRYFQWQKYRSKYIALLFAMGWISIGTSYAVFYEKWPLSESILFAIAAVSTAGSIPPPCVGEDTIHCSVGTFRALFVGTYIVIGVPIFAYTVGQFAEILVERAIKANEMKLMSRPLSPQEFRFAFELHRGEIVVDEDEDGEDESVGETASNSSVEYHSDFDETRGSDQGDDTSDADPSLVSLRKAFQRQKSWRGKPKRAPTIRLTLEDFIILEMLRLQKITADDLHYIKMLFDSLDEDGDGVILSPDEGIQLSREVTQVGGDATPHGDEDGHERPLLPNTAQKLSHFRPSRSESSTNSYLHPTMSAYGSLYAIPEHTSISERGENGPTEDDPDGSSRKQPADATKGEAPPAITSVDIKGSEMDENGEETATVIDDEETLEAVRRMRSDFAAIGPMSSGVDRIKSRQSSRKSSRADRQGSMHYALGSTQPSRRSSRSSSRADISVQQDAHLTDPEFISPIRPIFSRPGYLRSPSPSPSNRSSSRWNNFVSPGDDPTASSSLHNSGDEGGNNDDADDDGPFYSNTGEAGDGGNQTGESEGLAKISSQYNRLILSRLNQLHRQASAPTTTPMPSVVVDPLPGDALADAENGDGPPAEDPQEPSSTRSSLWGSVLSTVNGLVRSKRAVSESGPPSIKASSTRSVIQLAPFRRQPAGQRRLSLPGPLPSISSGKAFNPSDFSSTSSKSSRQKSERRATSADNNVSVADWSIGDWIDVERGQPATNLSDSSPPSISALNVQPSTASESTPLLGKK